ncbi:MAG: sporulation integral membrane protein YtvI [Clostridiales bacterium]|nr:sporulation integral membrane protein YtvI [Clostridiales bacterium]
MSRLKHYFSESLRYAELPLLLLIASAFLCLALILLPYLAPVVLGALLSALLEPMIRILTTKLHLSRAISAIIGLVLMLCVLGSGVFLLLSTLFSQLASLADSLPALWPDLLTGLRNSIAGLFTGIGIEHSQFWAVFDQLSGQFGLLLEQFAAAMGRWIIQFALSLPNYLLFLFVTLLSAFFFSKDKPKYKAFFRHALPLKIIRTAKTLYTTTLKSVLGYLKAEGILMSVTFVLLFLCLQFMGIPYALLISALIAIIDALPAVGAGLVLIPWALILALLGQTGNAVAIGIIYLLQSFTRQMLEPKLIGSQIGINPIVTMLAMYVGLKAFGIVGLIYSPFFVILLKSVCTLYLNGQSYRQKVEGKLPQDGF